MARVFTEYEVARNSQVLHWKLSIPRATSYSVNSQATVYSSVLTSEWSKIRRFYFVARERGVKQSSYIQINFIRIIERPR